MPRKPKVQRTPEERWQIVLEGLKNGNVAETCRKYEIAPTLYYRWKDEVEEGAKLHEAIDTLCYDYLEGSHGGWENNDGAFGEFHFDVDQRRVDSRIPRPLLRRLYHQPYVLREANMAHPYHHSLSSVKEWGGTVGDYQRIHDWFDESKKIIADFRHRALRHHAEGIFMAETIFGSTITLSTGPGHGECASFDELPIRGR
jgi:hypothetical protein